MTNSKVTNDELMQGIREEVRLRAQDAKHASEANPAGQAPTPANGDVVDEVLATAQEVHGVGLSLPPMTRPKSTMLALIAGVIQPQFGTVEALGRVAPLLELGAGFHFELTGRENIVLNAVLMGLTRRQAALRLDAIIAFSGLEAFLDEPLRTYSSGMVARLGLSVAAHLDPDILLIYEILAVGDAHFQAKCHERLMDFRRQGTTFVIVSHAVSEIRMLCDRVVWLQAGKIAMQGKPREVLEAYGKS